MSETIDHLLEELTKASLRTEMNQEKLKEMEDAVKHLFVPKPIFVDLSQEDKDMSLVAQMSVKSR